METNSIIIPVYNAEKTLDRCLGSILNSTYKNLEIITVDDDSSDNSLALLNSYAQRYSNIKVVHVAHGGVSKARNAGLRHATGKYLQFVDADDDIAPDMIEKMIKLIEENDADMSICRFNHPFFKTFYGNRVYDLKKPNDLLLLYEDTYGVVMPWNRIWKRECFKTKFDASVHFSEDELCNLANLPNVKKVVTTDECLYHYFIASKQNDEAENSCVNNIINSVNFWDNKTSFYYLGAKLLKKRRNIISKAIKNKQFSVQSADEMAHLRLIDYAFWQLPAYIGMGVSEYGLSQECLHIFEDKDFIAGFKAQEKYGFKLCKLSHLQRKILTEKFTSLCYKTYREKDGKQDFKTTYAFISLFLKIFTEPCGKLNAINQNARFLQDLLTNSTPEARFVNEVVE